jgi:hypothetical protein
LVAAATGHLSEADRLLVTAVRDDFTAADLVAWLYAPLLAGASVVLVRGDDPGEVDRIAAVERTTRRLAIS